MVEPNREDMERAKIVLDDALPYELDMLDASARYMQTDEFSKLTKPTTEIEWLTCNAIIESFWTHARCLIEFFSRRKNQDFTASAASAMDFTDSVGRGRSIRRPDPGRAESLSLAGRR
jgi:hypothetical protein